MPGRNERGDVEAALAGGRRAHRRRVPLRRQPPQPARELDDDGGLGRRGPADALRLDAWASARASSRSPHLLGMPRRRRARRRATSSAAASGAKAMIWPHVTLAAMAARHVGRPVRLALTRPQTFTSHGHREEQEQTLALGATRDGRLTAMRHHKLSITSPFDDWAEPATGVSSQLYACANYEGVHRLIRGNTMTPTFTRGPGEALGDVRARDRDGRARLRRSASIRSSCALRNHAAGRRRAATRGRATAWRSACALGAERFGWRERDPAPRSAPRRRLADRHRAWPRPRTRWRCSCPSSAPARASTPTAAPSCRPRRRSSAPALRP